MNIDQEILTALDEFRNQLQERIGRHFANSYPNLSPDTIRIDFGRKYAKVVKVREDGSASVHSFIDLNTGDIYKAANWKAPAKHVRGSILSEDGGMGAVSEYGANYLR
jgi:hypothetical protein